MPNPRTQCPYCQSVYVMKMSELLYTANVDYFRCESCKRLWHVPQGFDGPASQSLLGKNLRPSKRL